MARQLLWQVVEIALPDGMLFVLAACLAAKGLRKGEIAQRLVGSENTVLVHLKVVFEKFQIDRCA